MSNLLSLIRVQPRKSAPLAFALLPFCMNAATMAPTAQQVFGDDLNVSTISPYPATYQTFCNWILQGLQGAGFTTANGYNFAFAGVGVASGIANIPISDFNVNVYNAWVVTNDPFNDLGGTARSRPVNNQEAGGANFELSYTPRPNTTDPTNVNWLQAYLQSVNNAGFGNGILDNGGWTRAAGGSPYYNGVQPNGNKGISGSLANNVAWLLDIPYTCESGGDSNADCSGGKDDAWVSEAVQFQTFVAGANPVNISGKNYTILYGGEQWGYTYSSTDTPEPAMGALAGILVLGMAAKRYRSSRQKAESL